MSSMLAVLALLLTFSGVSAQQASMPLIERNRTAAYVHEESLTKLLESPKKGEAHP